MQPSSPSTSRSDRQASAQAVQVPAQVYDDFYPGAREVREMLQYFAEHTYFGPQGPERIAAANRLVPEGFTTFSDWARVHMKP